MNPLLPKGVLAGGVPATAKPAPTSTPVDPNAFAGCMAGASPASTTAGGSAVAAGAVAGAAGGPAAAPAELVTIGSGISGPIDGAAQVLKPAQSAVQLNASLGQLHTLLARLVSTGALARGGDTDATQSAEQDDTAAPTAITTFMQAPRPTATAAPAVSGGTSAAGRSFADRASTSLEITGGLGASELFAYWEQVPEGERAALAASVKGAVDQRLTQLSATAAGYTAHPPSRNDLGKLQLELASVRDLQQTVGLPQQRLTGAGLSSVRALLTAKVEQLETAAQGLVAARQSSGSPDPQGVADMGEGIADLAHIIGLADDAALRARLDQIPVTLIAAAR